MPWGTVAQPTSPTSPSSHSPRRSQGTNGGQQGHRLSANLITQSLLEPDAIGLSEPLMLSCSDAQQRRATSNTENRLAGHCPSDTGEQWKEHRLACSGRSLNGGFTFSKSLKISLILGSSLKGGEYKIIHGLLISLIYCVS